MAQLNAGSLLEPGWPERRHEIVAWLERLDPDVVCLQEISEDPRTPDGATWLATQMPGASWHTHFDGRPFASEMWPDPELRFGSAVLSRWPIDEATYHPLPIDEEDDDAFARACRRSSPATSTPSRSPTRSGSSRRARRSTAGPPTARTRRGWRGEGPGHTQDWRGNRIADAMNIPRKRIDYVFVDDGFMREGSAGRVLRAELAFRGPLTGTLANDHAGLVVDVAWPQRPPLA